MAIPSEDFPEDKAWLGGMDAEMAKGQFGWLMSIMCTDESRKHPRSWNTDTRWRILAMYRWFDMQCGASFEEANIGTMEEVPA